MATRSATIYQRKDRLFVHSSSQTTAGVWLAQPPVYVVGTEDAGEIGRSLSECLGASRTGLPHPTNFGGLFDFVLKAAGAKSYATFVKGTKSVDVRGDGKTVTLVPMFNAGAKNGFEFLPTKVDAPADSVTAIGRAALDALAEAE